jgi:PAS domain S-box-containing protein
MPDLNTINFAVDYDERVIAERIKNRVRERIFNEQLLEKNALLDKKITNLNKAELAILNILEDTKHLEGQLRAERDRMKAIVTAISEGLLVVDGDGFVRMVNPITLKMFGARDAEEVIGKKYVDFIQLYKGNFAIPTGERPIIQTLKDWKSRKIGLADDIYFQNMAGRKFPVSIAISPIVIDDKVFALAVLQDITEQKEFDEAKSNFVSIASHQLRTPLVSIRWFSEMLQAGDAGALASEQQDFVNRIYKGVIRLINLINTLLVMAKAESGSEIVQVAPLDIVVLTSDILRELDPQFKQKELTVTVAELAKNIPQVESDTILMRQVISNLVANAIRYTLMKGKINIEIGVSPDGDNVVYSVRDDGIGIPLAESHNIFHRFFRADNAKKMIGEGSGLGLTLVKSLVESWGGKVWFESPLYPGDPEKKGTNFYFTVPIKWKKVK